MRRVSQISKYLFLPVILIVLFVGLGYAGISADKQAATNNCFMPGMTEALCPMDALEHIAAWQNMFTAVPSQSEVLLLLFALLTLFLGAVFIHSHHNLAPPKRLFKQVYFLYYKQHVPVARSLQELFSGGLLHPQLYN